MKNIVEKSLFLLFRYGGWIIILDLPLKFWKRNVFDAIGSHFGGLVCISSNTLNLLDCMAAFIEVNQNVCGFLPASIETNDPRLGSFTFRVADDFRSSSLSVSRKSSSFSTLNSRDFSNSLDVSRIQEILEDEGSVAIKSPFYCKEESPTVEELIASDEEDGKRKKINKKSDGQLEKEGEGFF